MNEVKEKKESTDSGFMWGVLLMLLMTFSGTTFGGSYYDEDKEIY